MEILNKAVEALKAGKKINLEEEAEEQVEIHLGLPALLPEAYVPDINERLVLYKRIACAESEAALRELQVELMDRFGLLPEATKNLFEIANLKLISKKMGIKKMDFHAKGGRIEFVEKPHINVDKLLKKISDKASGLRLEGSSRVKFIFENKVEKITLIKNFLTEIA